MKAPVEAELARRGFDLARAVSEWTAAQRQIASLNSQRMITFASLGNSVINTVDEVRNLSRDLKLGGVPMMNKLELDAYINAQGNSPMGQLATKYRTAVGVLKEEFANLASGAYAPQEAAWKLADQQLNSNYGMQQLDASLSEIQKLIRYRIEAIPGLGTWGPLAPNRYSPAPATPPATRPPEEKPEKTQGGFH